MNKFFQSDDGYDFHMNACVGENIDSIAPYAYMQGFSDAFFSLSYVAHSQYYIHPISSEEKHVSLDGLIYPMLYCARHHLELFIKYQYAIISPVRNKEPNIPQGFRDSNM